MLFFSVYLQWLPALGYGGWQHIILPAVSIAFMSLAINARLLRASMLEVAGQRHVTWARLRGLNAANRTSPHSAQRLATDDYRRGNAHWRTDRRDDDHRKYLCLAGHRTLCRFGHFNRDYPVIQCFTLIMVVVFALCNLAVDLVNAALDPRIRRHEGARS